jgi:hypothetical protein
VARRGPQRSEDTPRAGRFRLVPVTALAEYVALLEAGAA